MNPKSYVILLFKNWWCDDVDDYFYTGGVYIIEYIIYIFSSNSFLK